MTNLTDKLWAASAIVDRATGMAISAGKQDIASTLLSAGEIIDSAIDDIQGEFYD